MAAGTDRVAAAVDRALVRAVEAERALARYAAPQAVQLAVERARADLDALAAELLRDRQAA